MAERRRKFDSLAFLQEHHLELVGVTGSWRDLQRRGRSLFLARSRHSAPQPPLASQRPRLSPEVGPFSLSRQIEAVHMSSPVENVRGPFCWARDEMRKRAPQRISFQATRKPKAVYVTRAVVMPDI